MDNKKKIFIGIGTLAVLICGYFITDHVRFVTTDDAQIDAKTIMLAPKVGGYIKEVKISEGQTVKAGDLLVQIDPRDYENTSKQVRAEKLSVEARMQDSEKNYRRLKELYSKGAVSQQQFETGTAQYSEVKAKYDSVSAQVAQAELNLENTKILAPSDGIIARKSAEIGQLAAPGIPVVGFVDSSERWVTANLKETDIGSVGVGNKVHIEVDAVSGDYQGTVESISPATGATFTLLPPDNATGNFTKVVQRIPIKIKIEKVSSQDIIALRAGLSAVVKVKKN